MRRTCRPRRRVCARRPRARRAAAVRVSSWTMTTMTTTTPLCYRRRRRRRRRPAQPPRRHPRQRGSAPSPALTRTATTSQRQRLPRTPRSYARAVRRSVSSLSRARAPHVLSRPGAKHASPKRHAVAVPEPALAPATPVAAAAKPAAALTAKAISPTAFFAAAPMVRTGAAPAKRPDVDAPTLPAAAAKREEGVAALGVADNDDNDDDDDEVVVPPVAPTASSPRKRPAASPARTLPSSLLAEPKRSKTAAEPTVDDEASAVVLTVPPAVAPAAASPARPDDGVPKYADRAYVPMHVRILTDACVARPRGRAAYHAFLTRAGPANPGSKPIPVGAPNCLLVRARVAPLVVYHGGG
jgi:hypothetical protein